MGRELSVAVYCGAGSGNHEEYTEQAHRVGELMAQRNYRLVYGGGHTGMMGAVADGALAHGGEVLGVIPNFLDALEIGHEGVTELRRTETMHERKTIMYESSQAVVVLPGGMGTLDEVFEMLTWKQLGLHQYPVIFLNTRGYWTGMRQQLAHMAEEGFIKKEHLDLCHWASHPNDVIDVLSKYAQKSVNFEK